MYKKTVKLGILLSLPLVLFSACTSKKENKVSKDNYSVSNEEIKEARKLLTDEQILNVTEMKAENSHVTPLAYNSALTTDMITGSTEGKRESIDINIPAGWEKIAGNFENAYKISTSSGDAVVDIWTAPSIKEDKTDKIMGVGWMTSDEVIKNYFKQQGVKAKLFKKKIGQYEFSLATANVPKNNQNIVTYCIIDDEGNFGSASIMTNVIMADQISLEDKSLTLSSVEGMLSQIEIKKNY